MITPTIQLGQEPLAAPQPYLGELPTLSPWERRLALLSLWATLAGLVVGAFVDAVPGR